MATLRSSAPSVRPQPVTIAVILSVILVIANFAGLLLPTGGEEVPTFAVVLSVVPGILGIPAAIGLWLLRRWGFVLTLVVMAINVLSVIGVFAAPTAAIKVFTAVFTVVSIVVIVLALRPDARAAYR